MNCDYKIRLAAVLYICFQMIQLELYMPRLGSLYALVVGEPTCRKTPSAQLRSSSWG